MRHDKLIKFMVAQRIKFYEERKQFGYSYNEELKELHAVLDMIDGLMALAEEDDMQANSLDQFMEMLLNCKDNEDTEE